MIEEYRKSMLGKYEDMREAYECFVMNFRYGSRYTYVITYRVKLDNEGKNMYMEHEVTLGRGEVPFWPEIKEKIFGDLSILESEFDNENIIYIICYSRRGVELKRVKIYLDDVDEVEKQDLLDIIQWGTIQHAS